MPIYEFKCKFCGNNFEYLCLRSDDKDHVMRYLDLMNRYAKISAKITISGGLVDKYNENHATIVVVMQFGYKRWK